MSGGDSEYLGEILSGDGAVDESLALNDLGLDLADFVVVATDDLVVLLLGLVEADDLASQLVADLHDLLLGGEEGIVASGRSRSRSGSGSGSGGSGGSSGGRTSGTSIRAARTGVRTARTTERASVRATRTTKRAGVRTSVGTGVRAGVRASEGTTRTTELEMRERINCVRERDRREREQRRGLEREQRRGLGLGRPWRERNSSHYSLMSVLGVAYPNISSPEVGAEERLLNMSIAGAAAAEGAAGAGAAGAAGAGAFLLSFFFLSNQPIFSGAV